MSYSLRTLFVVPVGNTVPTSGSTQDLTAGQVGFFGPDYSTTDGTGSPKYIYVAQGRTNTYLEASKRSDKIQASKVKLWYKVDGNATAAVQITDISNITAKCGEDVTFTFRLHSSYIDTTSFNGLTRSVTIKGACCDCDGDPCADADAEAIVDAFLAKIAQENALNYDPAALKLSTYLTFTKLGSGASTVLRVSGKALTAYGQPCDIAANPYEYDRMWFRTFVYKGPATQSDFIVADSCDSIADVDIAQRSSFPTGTSKQVAQLEKDYFSYQSVHKHLFRMNGYNELFESWVTDGEVYDFYYIQFDQVDGDLDWNMNAGHMDEGVMIAAPQGDESDDVETVLAAYLGAAEDKSADAITTTSSTTAGGPTTTTTTTLIP